MKIALTLALMLVLFPIWVVIAAVLIGYAIARDAAELIESLITRI